MDRNLFLAVTLSILVLLGWSMLQGGGEPRAPQVPPAEEQAGALTPSPAPVAQTPAPAPATVPAPPPSQPGAEERTLRIERPLYEAELTKRQAAEGK